MIGPLPALRLDTVSVHFGGVVALDRVSLEIRPGERRGIIGPNGAGKTTLFRVVSGECAPSKGSVHLFGEDVTRQPTHRRAQHGLGRTYQVNNLFPRLTVEQNVVLSLHGQMEHRYRCWQPIRVRGALNERVEHVLHTVGLTGRRHRTVRELSHGEHRQLELGLGLGSEPSLLLLDEPGAGLAPGERHLIRDLITSLPTEITVVLIEHDMDLLLGLVDRVTCLDDGHLVAEGTPDEIRRNPNVQAIYLKSL